MHKLIFLFFLLTAFLFSPVAVFAQSPSFVSVVNPVRGNDFWENDQQTPQIAVIGQLEILKQQNISATWLIRYDGLKDTIIIDLFKTAVDHEKGLFLEVTPTWTKEAGIDYHSSPNWHVAGSAFLTGYQPEERVKLLDRAFEQFKEVFGHYPKSVGAWWIDSFSLSYLQKKYGITAALIVADQYTTDNYQIWGQFWSTPYYPSKINALHPAQTIKSKTPLVITQWASRDPVNGYGSGVMESTYSVQANDYTDYHHLDINYFSLLVDIYTKQPLNKFGHLVVGLENSYSWNKYGSEYQKQIKTLAEKRKQHQLTIVSLSDFSSWYQKNFPDLSAEHIIVADDPLGTFKKVVWFMNPYYRAGLFINQDGSVIRDIHQYREGEEELCYQIRCDQVNFATSATRVLDAVSFGHQWLIDQGKIADFKVSKSKEKYIIKYKNEAENIRTIEFLPRDISVDGKIVSIDQAILDATKDQLGKQQHKISLEKGFFNWPLKDAVLESIKFLGFLIIGCLMSGLILIRKVLPKQTHFLQKMTLSLVLGFTIVSLIFYVLSYLKLKQIIFVYSLVNLFLLIRLRREIFNNFSLKIRNKFNFLMIGLIGAGTIFQQIPTFKNGLHFPYGLGFWGPNTHDGLWHISLINELIKSVPPQNPILAGEVLKNYHYFYDLLVAVTSYVSKVPVWDLLFRFYPITFSVLLGIGTYYLIKSLTNNKLAHFFSIYLVYFSGSFGWIVEYLKFRHLGGESAFWANQSISFNLNPPFAVSLLIVIALLQLLKQIKLGRKSVVVLSVLAGTLVAFKAYAGILILLTLLSVGILKKSLLYLSTFFISLLISLALFLANFTLGKQLIIFSPFWFIHSMIDSPDRVGWVRLSLARTAGLEQGNWFKFLAAEVISLLLFVVGNLGMRLFAIFSLIKIKVIYKENFHLFLFIFASLALLIPILVIQVGNPWNTIQFIYYFLYIAAVIGGIVFAKIITKIKRIFAIPLVTIFLIVTPINSWATANGYLSYQPHALVTNQELEALNFLKAQKDGVVLTYPYDQKLKNKFPEPWPIVIYDSTSYISALSERSVFIEDEPQNQILLTDYKKRLVVTKDFFSNPLSGGNQFLKEHHIKYIYLSKIHNKFLDESLLNIKVIFQNEAVIIYQVV